MAVDMLIEAPLRVNSTAEQLLTGDEFYALGDIRPCELVQGRVVPMSPPSYEHGEIEFTFGSIIRAFVREHRLGRVSGGEAGVYVSRDPDTVRGVDIMFISHERYARRSSAAFLDVAPDLVVEVLSPGNTMSEMMQNLGEYFGIGVRLVWLVDPKTRSVYAYRSLNDIRTFAEADDLPGDDVLPGFAVPVATLFEV